MNQETTHMFCVNHVLINEKQNVTWVGFKTKILLRMFQIIQPTPQIKIK